jgi:hypothetical protein
MNATEVFHDKIKGRITALQGRLEAQIAERMKTASLLEQMNSAILQMQGAITVLQELLEGSDERESNSGGTNVAAGQSVGHPSTDVNVAE